MKVKVYFIRHGESEANVAQHQQTCGVLKHLFMKDPGLTKHGINTCQICARDAPVVDIVLSSQLMRAIQTALYTYPTRFIQIVPFLNELGGGLDNSPLNPEEQNILLGKESKRIIRLDKRQELNLLEYLRKHIVPTFPNKSELKIALFTHSRLMRKYIGASLSELDNNIVMEREYDLVG